jgi:arylsulfatase
MKRLLLFAILLSLTVGSAQAQLYKDRAFQPMQRQAGDKPNIVLITLDHMRVDNVGANGFPHMRTPNMDSLVEEGQSFVRHQIAANACMPSRASLFTSRFPQNHGVITNGVPLPEDEITIEHVLQANGYFTGQIGKLHFWPHKERDHRGPHPAYGFDEMLLSDEPGCYDDAYGKWLETIGPEAREAGNLGLPGEQRRAVAKVFPGDGDWTHAGFVGDQSVRFIKRNAGRPFFMHAGFYAPHPPLNPPARDFNLYNDEKFPRRILESPAQLLRLPPMYQKANVKLADWTDEEWQHYRQCFYGMVSDVDHWIGRMVETLKVEGIYENTFFVVTSDHGDHLGDHNQTSKNSFPYKAVYTVPLIMRGPGISAKGIVRNLVSAVDVMPTLLESADAPLPRAVQGVSLWPLMKNGKNVRDYTFSETSTMRMVQTDEFKYAHHKNGVEILYDLQADPDEVNNLSLDPAYRDQLAKMRTTMLSTLWEIADDKLERITSY